MNILVTVNAAWNIWNFRRAVVAALLADGHEVTVLAPPDDSVEHLEVFGCRFIPLTMDVKGLNPLRDVALMLRLLSIFRRERYDVILSYTIKNNVFGAFAAKSVGIPFVPNVSGLGTAFLKGRLMQTIAETLYDLAFAGLPIVFFQNEDDRELFQERGLITDEQARLLPGSGIDLTHFAPAPYQEDEDAPVFLLVGRLLRDKGVVEFVEAARAVKREVPGARFQLLGPLTAENRTAIDLPTVERWVEEGLVEYLGSTTDVRPYIARSGCVVLPSYREGAPRTLIEAGAMARPLITTNVPGCRSVVDDGVSGLLCEGKSAESLAAAVLRFLALPVSERRDMGLAARAKMAAEFDEAIVVKAYHDAIKMVTRKANSKSV